jgi:hypothetical protein
MKHLFTLLFTLSLTSASAQSEQQAKQKMHAHNKAAGSDPTVQASNMRSDTVDILNYNISLNITDFITNTIAGNTVVSFAPKMNGINRIGLDLLMLTVDSVQMSGIPVTYSYNDTLLSVNLDATYNIGDTNALTVFYHGAPQGDASGWGGFYFQSGYAYNLGVGFAALPHNYGRVWFPCFDNFVERSTYKFNITTNAGKIAYCNGSLAADFTVGADRTRVWVMDQQIPSYLASVTVAPYAEIDQSFNSISGSTIPIVIAAVASDTTAVKNSFINLPIALSTFENHFGPYMWNRVGYCMVPFNSGAMEHATNISYPKITATGSTSYQNLYAHELSHHWFGDLATCRTAEDMWLNEGWAHYCEFLFYEALSGYPSYLNAVRVNHEDNIHFNHIKEGGFQALANVPQTYTYGDHVYNKGADVAHTMRGYLGDSLFFYSVKTYLANNHYTDVSSADFRDALSAASGVDMTDFFNNWVFNPGWPHFSIDSTQVTPSGSNYNVTVYVKQKLTGAPSYFSNVPLEVTFKKADMTEDVQSFVMSGPGSSFTFTVPFDPVFVALNMGEKISHAVAPEYKTIKVTGGNNFANAKMTMNVTAISDSAFIRVEHNYAAPDAFHSCCIPYRLSPRHYWKVDGILPAVFDANAVINYDGRTTGTTGNMWLDDLLNITTEDSLVMMYRANPGSEWAPYPYCTINYIGSHTDKRGLFNIDSVLLGEYAIGMHDYAMGIQNNSEKENTGLAMYPNPASDNITFDLLSSGFKSTEHLVLQITDAGGKHIAQIKAGKNESKLRLNTSGFANGIYFVTLVSNGNVVAKDKFVVSK